MPMHVGVEIERSFLMLVLEMAQVKFDEDAETCIRVGDENNGLHPLAHQFKQQAERARILAVRVADCDRVVIRD